MFKLAQNLKMSSMRSFSTMTPFLAAQEAAKLHGAPTTKFIDCRDPNEYAAQHIAGAVHVNEIFAYLARSDAQGLHVMQSVFEDAFQRAGINKGDQVVTYENTLNTRFGSSSRGYFLLKTFGHAQVQVLDGGMDAWKNMKLPVDDGHVQPERGDFQVKWDASMWASQQDVENAIKDKSAVLLDVRDDDEWQGSTSSPYGPEFVPRKGRLPGAVHMNWKELFTTDAQGLVIMKNKDEIEAVCTSKGIKKDEKVIVYCFKGARASNSLIALKYAGFNHVTNYFGSWNEWARNFNLEIDDESK